MWTSIAVPKVTLEPALLIFQTDDGVNLLPAVRAYGRKGWVKVFGIYDLHSSSPVSSTVLL